MKNIQLLALAGAFVLAASPAAAQSLAPATSVKGFSLGAHLTGAQLSADDLLEDSESGAGAGIHLGWGFTPRLQLIGDFNAAKVDDGAGGDLGLVHIDIGVRYSWTGARKWVPSVEAAISSRAVGQETDLGDITASGAGFTLGGGVQYFLSPKLALGAQLKWTGGKFSKFEIDGDEVDGDDIDATSTRVNVGLTWYPSAKK